MADYTNDIPLPAAVPTDYHQVNGSNVLLTKFDVGKAQIRPEHDRFVAGYYVDALISQIAAVNDPNMTHLTLHLFGYASATRKTEKNLALSQARAAAVGESIKRHFNTAKGRSPAAARINDIAINARGEGDEKAREALAGALRHARLKRGQVADSTVEALQFGARSVLVSSRVRPQLTEDYFVYHARQIYVIGIKREKLRVSEFEHQLDAVSKALGPDVMGLLGVFVEEVKMVLKTAAKEVAKDVPLLFLIEEALEFMVPSDIALCFQFRDHRQAVATYNYFGSENRDNISPLKLLSKLFGFLKVFGKISASIDRLAQRFKKLEDFAKNVENVKRVGPKLLASLGAKGGALRRVFCDDAVDMALNIAAGAALDGDIMTAPVSDWAPFRFHQPHFYDVNSFSGFARTLVGEYLYESVTTLDFASKQDIGSTGCQASVAIVSRVSLRNNLLAIGVSHGTLMLRAGAAPQI